MSLYLVSIDPFYVYEILLCLHRAESFALLLQHSNPIYKNTIFCLFILFMDGHLGTFWFGAIKENAAMTILYISFGVLVDSFLLEIYIGIRLLGYRVCICSTLVDITI